MAVPYEKSRVFRQVAATSRSFAALDTEGAVLVWGRSQHRRFVLPRF